MTHHQFPLPVTSRAQQPIRTPVPTDTSYVPGRERSQLNVRFGQATFNAEGQEAEGPFFSRVIHWPKGSAASGVTLGRGYDMGQRTPLQIKRELEYAGLSGSEAAWFSAAAGLRGSAAESFVAEHQASSPTISAAVQKKLFEEINTPEIIADIRRILTKPDVVSKYGYTEWRELKPNIQALLFDLRFRGDYTPAIREVIQPLVVSNDDAGLLRVMNQRSLWEARGVPSARIRERILMMAPHG